VLLTLFAAIALQNPQVAPAAPTLATAQPQAAAPVKKKRNVEQCAGDEASLGSHMVIPCTKADEYEQLRERTQSDKFKEAAREIEADEDESRWE
jgi:hypothetical protein